MNDPNEVERLKTELANERKVSAALRKEVLELGHRAAVERGRCKDCEFHPHHEQERA